jgi:uncharacterized protein
MYFKLAKNLVESARLVHPHTGMRDIIWRAKYCLRGLAQARLTREWFLLLQKPELVELTRMHPHMLSKLQRAYLHRTLGPRQRLDALRTHYSFVAEHFSKKLIQEIFGRAGFLLTKISLEGAGQIEVRLRYCHHSGKEGDLTIWIQDAETKSPLYSITFSIVGDCVSGRELFIGGLQGFSPAHEDRRVVEVTRAMHGLRPKALALSVLQQLATLWGCSAIRAVSDTMHIYRHYQRRKTFAAQYDDFWLECGGRLAADRLFDLPLKPVLRPLLEIKANKRQMYRRRYALLENLNAEICENVHPHFRAGSEENPLNSASPFPVFHWTGQDDVPRPWIQPI